jgi:hypothetical protein
MASRCLKAGWLVVLLFCASSAHGFSPVIRPVLPYGFPADDDSTIFSESLNAAGGDEHLYLGTTESGAARRVLVRFNLSALSPEYVVGEAQLGLTVVNAPGSDPDPLFVAVHRVLRPWTEGRSSGAANGAPPARGDVTWASASHEQLAWSAAGGDYVATPSAVAEIGPAGTQVLWFGDRLAADVQAWIDAPSKNFGWILVSRGEGVRPGALRVLQAHDRVKQPHAAGAADVNGDGALDALDVQLVINRALGIVTGAHDADLDRNGRVDSNDVQWVINAALGDLVLASFPETPLPRKPAKG